MRFGALPIKPVNNVVSDLVWHGLLEVLLEISLEYCAVIANKTLFPGKAKHAGGAAAQIESDFYFAEFFAVNLRGKLNPVVCRVADVSDLAI